MNFKDIKNRLTLGMGLDGSQVSEEQLTSTLVELFSDDLATKILKNIQSDLHFFNKMDPASKDYSAFQILNIRRAMSAIVAHRIFKEILHEKMLSFYEVEILARIIQRETNVEIHPCAEIGVPFAIDHGHGTVIGATSRLGSEIFMYHSVTLGASTKTTLSGRRHPIVGNKAYFGNGIQVLGPCILSDNVAIGAGSVIKDSHLNSGVKVAMETTIRGVILPAETTVYSSNSENPRMYWACLQKQKTPSWIEFEQFRPSEVD